MIDYEVYNVNVNTGKPVSNADILKSKNIEEQEFLSKLSKCYEDKFIELWGYLKDDYEEYTRLYNKTVSTANYNMQVPMFMDSTGNINVVGRIYSAAGADYYDYIINTNM